MELRLPLPTEDLALAVSQAITSHMDGWIRVTREEGTWTLVISLNPDHIAVCVDCGRAVLLQPEAALPGAIDLDQPFAAAAAAVGRLLAEAEARVALESLTK